MDILYDTRYHKKLNITLGYSSLNNGYISRKNPFFTIPKGVIKQNPSNYLLSIYTES